MLVLFSLIHLLFLYGAFFLLFSGQRTPSGHVSLHRELLLEEAPLVLGKVIEWLALTHSCLTSSSCSNGGWPSSGFAVSGSPGCCHVRSAVLVMTVIYPLERLLYEQCLERFCCGGLHLSFNTVVDSVVASLLQGI